MTFADIREAVGRKCSLVDSSGAFVDGLVSEADVLALSNIRWRELHTKFSEKFPDGLDLEFTKDLVDGTELYEVNEATADDDSLTYVAVKYATSDTFYTRAKRARYKTLKRYDTDSSKFSTTNPYYAMVPSRQDAEVGSSQQAIKAAFILRPIPDANVTDGLLVKFVEEPEPMVIDADTPYTLPKGMHSVLVDYVVADVWEIKRDWANSNEAMNRAVMNEKAFFANYQPTSMDEPVRIDPGKTWDPYSGR